MGPQCPDPLSPDIRDPGFAGTPPSPPPGPSSPGSAPSPVRSRGRRRGPSDSRCLPALAPPPPLGQESPLPAGGRRPAWNPPPQLRLRTAHCAVCPLLSSASVVIGQLSTSGSVVAVPSSAPVTRLHAHTFRGSDRYESDWCTLNQSTTPRYLVMSLVKGTEGGNSSRP